MTAVLNPSSTRPKAALRPAPPAPTTTASYWWSTTGYCLEIASVFALAESWPETVKLKFLAALAWSCGPFFSSPVIRGIPAILPLAFSQFSSLSRSFEFILLNTQFSGQFIKFLFVVRSHLGGFSQIFVCFLNLNLAVHGLALKVLDLFQDAISILGS